MKRFWLAVAILLVLLSATYANSRYLDATLSRLGQTLTRAQTHALQDDWLRARQLTQEVSSQWQAWDFYFHVLLPHRDIDTVHLTLCEVEEYLQLEELDQYTAANARLVAQLGLLAEMEQLNLKNIL